MPDFPTQLPALVVILTPWVDFNDDELPRHGHGFRDGMTRQELEDSARGWWNVAPAEALKRPYIVAAFDGITRGVWAFDATVAPKSASPALCQRLGVSERRWGFGVRAAPVEIWDAFVGRNGRGLPYRPYRELRYWPPV